MPVDRWWTEDVSERYWLEATDRSDIGANLRAPEADESGRNNWRYTLFKEAQVGDVVLHYDQKPAANGIVGFSRIAGPWRAAPIVWAARGSYAREKGARPHERPGYVVPLAHFTPIAPAISLEAIRRVTAGLRLIVSDLQLQHHKPIYFPFELSDTRPLRLLQGYAFKLPRAVLGLFPVLARAVPGAPISANDRAADNQSELARGTGSAGEVRQNPPWSRDELILALELYLRSPAAPPGTSSAEVVDLSDVLNKLGRQLGYGKHAKFRNANGVYMKMMNFRRFDPVFRAQGRVGLARGNKDEEAVWSEFAANRARLREVAAAIRAAVENGDVSLAESADDRDDMVEAPEGRILTRLHQFRERNRMLVARRKAKALQVTGRLQCEVCDFDFEERYGKRGHGFIECHHTRPVHMLSEGEATRLEDLSLLCSNCHRMIHAARPWLSVDELRKLLSA